MPDGSLSDTVMPDQGEGCSEAIMLTQIHDRACKKVA